MQHFTSFDGTCVAFAEQGEGPAVLLLHGFLVDSDLNWGAYRPLREILADDPEGLEVVVSVYQTHGLPWPPEEPPAEGRPGTRATLLEAGFRTVELDMRGHGRSDKPSDPSAYADRAMARDALTLLDHLGIDSAHVVGYSMGSLTALHVLELAAPRVHTLTLAGAGDGLLATGEPVFRALADAWREPPGPNDPRAAQLVLCRALGSPPEVMAAAAAGHMSQVVDPNALAGTTCPVHVLNSELDASSRATDRLAKALPSAQVDVVAAGDHGTAYFYPSFQTSLVNFLQQ